MTVADLHVLDEPERASYHATAARTSATVRPGRRARAARND